jgi:hypothetical protein
MRCGVASSSFPIPACGSARLSPPNAQAQQKPSAETVAGCPARCRCRPRPVFASRGRPQAWPGGPASGGVLDRRPDRVERHEQADRTQQRKHPEVGAPRAGSITPTWRQPVYAQKPSTTSNANSTTAPPTFALRGIPTSSGRYVKKPSPQQQQAHAQWHAPHAGCCRAPGRRPSRSPDRTPTGAHGRPAAVGLPGRPRRVRKAARTVTFLARLLLSPVKGSRVVAHRRTTNAVAQHVAA